MTQLPPKIPISCPSLFPYSPTSLAAQPTISSHCSWADELFEQPSHLRTFGHSVAITEPLTAANSTTPFMTSSNLNSGVNEDNKASLNPPSSYDQLNCSARHEQSEGESSGYLHLSAATTDNTPQLSIQDPKRLKRILANRQSARRSRVRKFQYISELEKIVATLQTEVSALSPRVAFLDQQRSILTVGNSLLKQRIVTLARDKIFKDAHKESLKKEIERLSLVYQQQNLKKMTGMTAAIHAGGDDAATIVVQNDLLVDP